MTITVQKFVLCDDVRMEITNKALLIGVYTGDVIQVPKFPFNIYVSIYMEVTSNVTGDFRGTFAFEGPNLKPVGLTPGQMRIQFPHTSTPIYLLYMNFEALTPGEFWLTWQLPGQPPEKMHKLTVIQHWKAPS